MSQEPTNSNSDITADDMRDRLVDRALAERLAGDTPPDLTARILAAAEPSSLARSNQDTSMDSQSSSRRSSARTWVLAASLLVNCGLVAMLVASSNRESDVVVNGRETSVEQLNHAFTGQEKLSLRELQTAARTEPVIVDGVDPKPAEPAKSKPTTASAAASSSSAPLIKQPVGTVPRYREQLKGADASRKEARWDTNYNVELGPAPEPVKVEVVYPTEEVWEELTNRREKLKRVDVGEDRLASLAIADAEQSMSAAAGGANANLNFHRYVGADRGGTADHYASEARDYDHTAMYSQLMDARGDGRAKWGWQRNGRIWPQGQPWQGSPDGQGIGPDASGDKYDLIVENAFIPAIGGEAVSTFSIDVDTASYANVRQMLRNSQVPPADAVRLEEFVNYFDYEYETPTPNPSPASGGGGSEDAPFAAHVETSACPWQPSHRLVRIGIKGREIAPEKRPLSNLVFLVDVSGSMNEADKLPLVVHGLKKLTEQLGENDRVAIVVYASSEGLVLPSTPGTEKETILAALDSLAAGGSTAGGAGITLAYQIAQDNFIEGGTNRVILCTDGDFNVGTTSTAELERMVEQKAKDTKVFLSCIGFGRGNLNDAMMENITGIGNGNYYYADGEQESERIFVKGMTGMLVTIAKDVKIQVEFNPAKVAGYRLLGYENRMLATQDFNDDKKDAGEIGAGHTVTCLYEIVPTGEELEASDIDAFKYQRPAGLTPEADTDELLTLKMRYKKPDGDTSTKLEWPVIDSGHKFGEASQDMQFAAAVASFGMLLRDSKYKGDTNYDAVIEIAESAKGKDPEGERAEFVELVRAAKQLKPIVIEEKEEATPAEKE